MKVRGEWRNWLKTHSKTWGHGTQSHHFIANRRGKSRSSDRFYFLGLQNHWTVTAVMTNLDSMLQSRDITLPSEVCIVKAMVFPVVMCRCESWTIKKSECQKVDAFELWCWRNLLRVPWTARRSNLSILNIDRKDGCWSWSPSTLATWCEELTHWKRPW